MFFDDFEAIFKIFGPMRSVALLAMRSSGRVWTLLVLFLQLFKQCGSKAVGSAPSIEEQRSGLDGLVVRAAFWSLVY